MPLPYGRSRKRQAPKWNVYTRKHPQRSLSEVMGKRIMLQDLLMLT